MVASGKNIWTHPVGNQLSTALSGPGGGKLCVLSIGFSDARVTNLGRPRAGDKSAAGRKELLRRGWRCKI